MKVLVWRERGDTDWFMLGYRDHKYGMQILIPMHRDVFSDVFGKDIVDALIADAFKDIDSVAEIEITARIL